MNNIKIKNKEIRKLEEIYNYDKLTNEDQVKLEEVVKRHPMRIPKYYYNLIDWDDETDPIKKLSVPHILELNASGDYDTSGESTNTKFPGLQHKYSTTALVLSTNVCFMYCRHCFRKRMVGYSREEIMTRMKHTVDYVKSHKEVNNVLITGGDAFTMSNKMIEKYLVNLSEIEHLDFIRFGTRSLVVRPERVYKDHELLKLLEKYNKLKEIIIVTQFNHPKEITEEAKLAINALKEVGCTIRNQAVLLKGINNEPDTLALLLNKLTSVGIHPYYVFQCRPVKFVTHFQVSLSKGIEIIEEAKKKLNGISKAFRYIMSHPRGKIEIFSKTKKDFIFKFHQNKYPEDANKVFIRTIDENANWLDEDLELIEK
ncbi:MAG: KamA family radical SAM protein [Candidatus Izimaplasma sp.]|nr:KamA family radical SAM protein [Candidatus Izimaplasma bacterium]